MNAKTTFQSGLAIGLLGNTGVQLLIQLIAEPQFFCLLRLLL